MSEIIKPRDLNPDFLKNIEKKYGEINMVNDFFDSGLTTYYKTSNINDVGSVTHDIIRLPSFSELFKNLGKAKNSAQELSIDSSLKNDEKFQSQASNVIKTFNSFRTFFRKNYPNQYNIIKSQIKEITTTSAGGNYLTKYAFGKASNYYTKKLGYTPVNQKSLRKKSKGMDYVDLHKH
ncbi:hypothetical protein OAA26_00510 [bacterium]|nr:hypothetical protein [bacterium]